MISMEWILKMTAIAMISGLLIVLLEKSAPANALVLSAAVTVLIALTAISFLEPILSFLHRMERICGISAVYVGTLLKCLLVSMITRLGVFFCKDAGQSGMASMLELSGMLVSVWIAIPLFDALLSVLEELM